MAFTYDLPPTSGSLIQGEVLANVWEHQPVAPPVEIAGETLPFRSVRHPLTVVLNPECDLYWDHQHIRSAAQPPPAEQKEVPYVFLCEAYTDREVRGRDGINSAVWKSIVKNQDERYHVLPSADIGAPSVERLPLLCLDFKKVLAITTELLYTGLASGIRRVAVLPRIYREHLFVRYGYYVARVSLPE